MSSTKDIGHFWPLADDSAIAKLVDVFKQGCILFVGAGISWAQFPLARDLKQTIIRTLIENAYEVTNEKKETFLSHPSWTSLTLETLIGRLFEAFGKEALDGIIQLFQGGSPRNLAGNP